MVNYPLGDLLTRIRNAQAARLSSITTPVSKFGSSVLEVLKREGYIREYSVSKKDHGGTEAVIELKYSEGIPAIREIDCISTPGRRVYSAIKSVPKVYNGLGISILSTPRGVMSDKEARVANVGGELLCRVF